MTDTAVAESPSTEVDPAVNVVADDKPTKAKAVATPCACSLYYGTDGKGEALSTDCEAVTVRTFGPGHDAKLKSLLIKTAVAGEDVIKVVDGTETELSPVHAAEEYGFRDLVEKGVETHRAKIAKRDEAKAERERKANERRAAKDEAKAERKRVQEERKAQAAALKAATDKANAEKVPGPARAKVGRTEFDGEVLQDGTFKYTNSEGTEVETEKYTIVVDPTSINVAAN